MNIDVSPSNKLWKDRINLEIGIAVSHSFKKAGCVIIDQHTLVSISVLIVYFTIDRTFQESSF